MNWKSRIHCYDFVTGEFDFFELALVHRKLVQKRLLDEKKVDDASSSMPVKKKARSRYYKAPNIVKESSIRYGMPSIWFMDHVEEKRQEKRKINE